MVKAVISGRADEVIDLARTHFCQKPSAHEWARTLVVLFTGSQNPDNANSTTPAEGGSDA